MKPFYLAALSLLGCVPEFEDNLSTVGEPRLLAIQAEPAEVEEGGGVTFRALVAARDQVAVPVPSWSLCLTRKPLTELGPLSPECLTVADDGSGKVAALGAGLEIATTVPRDACKLFGPTRPEPQPGELPGRPVDPDTTGGYYQPAVAALDDVLSIGSVRLSCGLTGASRAVIQAYNADYRPNTNPTIAALDIPETVTAGSSVTLRASWNACPPDDVAPPEGCGAERYVSYDSERGTLDPRREGLRLAWYASGGVFEQELTGREESDSATDSSNVWTAPAIAGSHTVWLVLRDSRGGSSWQRYDIEVVP